jgi:nitroreductase
MLELTPKSLLDRLNWRYAVKRFDPTRRIDDSTWQALEASLVLTPSSYGLQPWRFIVITDEAMKAKLPAISWNQKQPQDCSHMVVLAARKAMDAAYIDRFMHLVTETRCLPEGAMTGYRNMLVSTIGKDPDRHLDWNSRQVYIALGQLMTTAAILGVDACPMEGIHLAAYDELLQLNDSDYTTVVACALGYRHPEDQQAVAAKVRFQHSEIVTHI